MDGCYTDGRAERIGYTATLLESRSIEIGSSPFIAHHSSRSQIDAWFGCGILVGTA